MRPHKEASGDRIFWVDLIRVLALFSVVLLHVATVPAERFWFGYARLRDVSVLVHEGYLLPELFLDLVARRCTRGLSCGATL